MKKREMAKYRFLGLLRTISLVSFILLLLLCGCNNITESNDPKTIFFTYKSNDEWQVWAITIPENKEEVVYELPVNLSWKDAQDKDYISAEIGDAIKKRFPELNETLRLQAEILEISLSQDKNSLAILESILFCPGNYCDGQYSLNIVDLNSKSITSVFQTRDILSNIEWSQDSKLLKFSRLEMRNFINTPVITVLDIQNSKELFSIDGSFSKFTHENNVFVKYEANNDGSQRVNCCQVINPYNGEIVKDDFLNINLNDSVKDISILGDGKRFAYSQDIESSDNASEIVILNYLSPHEKISKFTKKSHIDDVEWSISGEFIAFSNFFPPHSLSVMDAENGKDLFKIVGVRDWEWFSGNGENQIIYLTANVDNNCVQKDISIHIYNFEKGKEILVNFPPEISNTIDNWKNDIVCKVFVSDITW